MKTLSNKKKAAMVIVAIISAIVVALIVFGIQIAGAWIITQGVSLGMSESTIHALGLTALLLQVLVPLWYVNDTRAAMVTIASFCLMFTIAIMSVPFAAFCIPFILGLPFSKITAKHNERRINEL